MARVVQSNSHVRRPKVSHPPSFDLGAFRLSCVHATVKCTVTGFNPVKFHCVEHEHFFTENHWVLTQSRITVVPGCE